MRLRLSVNVLAPLALAAGLSGCLSSSILETDTGGSTVLPALEAQRFDSLGGGKIAFQRFGTTAGNFRGLYYVDGTARTVQSLLATRAIDRAALSPSSGVVAYGAQSNSGSSLFDIYITRLADSVETRITTAQGIEQYPSWSITGGQLYYWYRGNGSTVIVRQNPVAGAVRDSLILADSNQFGYVMDSPVSVNAAGRMTFVVGSTGWRIWAVDFAGTNRVLVKGDPRTEVSPIFQGPAWSPDGLKIGFLELNFNTADQLVSTTLKTINPDGTGEVSIATVPTVPFTFSPNSFRDFSLCWLGNNRIAFTALGNDLSSHVYVARLTPAVTLTQMTTTSGVFDRGVSCKP